MTLLNQLVRWVLCAMLLSSPLSHASDPNLLPKYGALPKNAAMLEADRKFIASMDQLFNGDRSKAASELAAKGWTLLRSGDADTAIKRFNQAWLMDTKNAQALWGMAVISMTRNDLKTAVTLFLEAEHSDSSDINLGVDCARAMSMLAASSSDSAMMKEAMARFQRNAQRAPEHPMNWHNWAVALYYIGDYAGAWEKLAKIEKLGLSSALDPRFVSALSEKMARPVTFTQ